MRLSRFYLVSILALGVAVVFPARGRAQETAQLKIGGGTMDLTFDAKPSPALRDLTLAWTTRAANAVTVYYGHFPVSHVDIAVHIGEGSGVGVGHAWGYDGPHIDMIIGATTTLDDLSEGGNDWMMTHEMVHLAFSSVAREHHWIEEGLATYVEPIARVRAGELRVEDVWNDMVEHMPQGQPAAGDQGLDFTPTWGRTYWGGAIFCLLADVEIRKKTHNRVGLETALRGIIKDGGTIDTEWDFNRVLAAGDKAVGVPVLQPLYDQMKAKSTPVDLDDLWRQLGVEKQGDSVIFHDDAPLANIRKAIMAP